MEKSFSGLILLALFLPACQVEGDGSQGAGGPAPSESVVTPAVLSPTSNPAHSANQLSIRGSCTDGFQVSLSGDDTQTVPCTLSTYSFSVTKPTDGTYSFSVSQASLLTKKTSLPTSLKWVRDSSVPNAPTVTSPAANPYSSSDTLTLSGTCAADSEVNLTGDLKQTVFCSPSGTYSIIVTAAQDGTYNLEVSQTNRVGTSSVNNPTLQWQRDSATPSTNITSSPDAVNLSSRATFSFTSPVSGATFKCSLDGGFFSLCTSPYITSVLTNGPHQFSVESVDPSETVDPSPPIYSWTQEVYDTVALYHFDSASGMTEDSSSLTGSAHGELMNAGTTSGASAKFGQSVQFTAASSTFMSAPNNPAQALLSGTMTVEGFVSLNSLPSLSYVIASKMGEVGAVWVGVWDYSE